jgi:hypothetical protein
VNKLEHAWKAFLLSSAGVQCLEPSILGADERNVAWLKNRLRSAFIAGYQMAENSTALETTVRPSFEGSLCEHVPAGYACEICNHDGVAQ